MVYNFKHDTLEEYSLTDTVTARIYEDFSIDFSELNIVLPYN